MSIADSAEIPEDQAIELTPRPCVPRPAASCIDLFLIRAVRERGDNEEDDQADPVIEPMVLARAVLIVGHRIYGRPLTATEIERMATAAEADAAAFRTLANHAKAEAPKEGR